MSDPTDAIGDGAGGGDAGAGPAQPRPDDASLRREPRTGLMLTPAMAERYGVVRTPRWAVTLLAFLVVGFVGGVLWVGYRLATPDTQVKLLAFRVVDDTRVDVTFEVRRDSLTTTYCVLRAQDEHHTDVGYAPVRITPGREYVQVTYPLATYAEATVAEVLACRADQPPVVDPPGFLPGTTNPPQVDVVDGS